jgi:predicted nucleic acid-binding Zn ribbon protein
MPTYEYLCEANGQVVEVKHKMAEELRSWGELCERAAIATGDVDPNSPVRKLISAGFISTGGSSEPVCDAPVCGSGACGTGMCGM